MKKAKYHFYTLTELLVVVAIAAILLGITLPAFNVLIKGNAMTSATNELAAKIKATRAYAITNNCYTALLFPDSSFPKEHFRYRSYRPCILNKVSESDGTIKYEFDSWIEEENWTLIPPGIVFSSTNEANANLVFKAMTAIPQKAADVKDTNVQEPLKELSEKVKIPAGLSELPGVTAVTTMPLIMIFRPDGQLHEHIIFALQEGTVVNGAVVDTQAAGQRVYYPIFINKRSGKITYFDPLSKDTAN